MKLLKVYPDIFPNLQTYEDYIDRFEEIYEIPFTGSWKPVNTLKQCMDMNFQILQN